MSRSRVNYFKKLARTFPDDPDAHRFYVRDLLIPRFHPLVVGDVINAMKQDDRLHSHRDELVGIFQDYADTVFSVASVPASFKRRLRWHLRLLNTRSDALIHTAHFAIAGLKHANLLSRH